MCSFNCILNLSCHKQIFKKYIEIELQLGNIERCRKLYEKYLGWSPENCYAWIKYAELERSLAETERARALFELAIDQPALDMPELLWKVLGSLLLANIRYALRIYDVPHSLVSCFLPRGTLCGATAVILCAVLLRLLHIICLSWMHMDSLFMTSLFIYQNQIWFGLFIM